MPRIPVLLFMLILAFADSTPAQPNDYKEIRVRILQSNTHRPMKRRTVEIQFSGADGQWYSPAKHLIGHTNSKGVVVFKVIGPVPPRIDIIDLKGYPCSFPEEFETSQVLQRGIVAGWQVTGVESADKWCRPLEDAPVPIAAPGEVVFFVHQLNFWQRIQYEYNR
jgi:hypothetical protein